MAGDLTTETNQFYDAVDALSDANRGLLVTEALGYASRTIREMATDPNLSMAMVAVMTQTLMSLLSTATYANEVRREDAGETSTSDRQTEAVLMQLVGLVQKALTADAPESGPDVVLDGLDLPTTPTAAPTAPSTMDEADVAIAGLYL